MTFIFVYGTLMRGGQNHHYLAQQQFIGPACTRPGFTLYSLGAYPGMVASTDQQHAVNGEIWSVDEPTLKKLDDLEGVAEQLYARQPISLAPPCAQQTVQTYIYLRDLAGCPHLGANWQSSR